MYVRDIIVPHTIRESIHSDLVINFNKDIDYEVNIKEYYY
jgi:hypothetical protein